MTSREPSGYERWLALIDLQPRLHRRSLLVLGLVTAAAIVGLGTLAQTGASGVLAGAVAAVATLSLLVAYLIVWFETSSRVHQALVRRVRWNDVGRLSLFLAAFFGFPVGTIGPVVLIILLTGAR